MTTHHGIIYCMANEDQPGILNLGKTTRHITAREKEHSSGQSAPWITVFAVPVIDVDAAEDSVFAELDAYRPKRWCDGHRRPERLKNAPLLDVAAAFKRVGGAIKERHELLNVARPRTPKLRSHRTPASELHVNATKAFGYAPCRAYYWDMIVDEAYEMNSAKGNNQC